jgi:hypothetical protein
LATAVIAATPMRPRSRFVPAPASFCGMRALPCVDLAFLSAREHRAVYGCGSVRVAKPPSQWTISRRISRLGCQWPPGWHLALVGARRKGFAVANSRNIDHIDDLKELRTECVVHTTGN